MKCFAFACALIALTACAETGAKAKVDVETSKTFDMRRPRAEDYTSGPKPSRRVRAVLWGVTHNHALGKFEAMKKLKDDYEIVGIVDNSSSKVMRMCEPDMKHYEGLPRFTPEQVLNEVKPDIAVIEVSNQELIDVALKCAKAGIAMHMDKPLGFTLEGFRELAEIVRGERPNPQELYDHDLRVHRLSLQACNIPLAEGKDPVAVGAFESGGHRIVASDKELDVR